MNIYNALGFDGKPTTRSFDAWKPECLVRM